MIHWIFTHSWIFIIELLYIVWTVYAFSDSVKAFRNVVQGAKGEDISFWKYLRTYGFACFTDDDDGTVGFAFLVWLLINGVLFFVASFVAFRAEYYG